jgi:ATP synthase protein I
MGNDDRSSLDELEAKLRKARAAHEPADSSRDGRAGMASATRQIGVAYRIFVELLAGILVGAGLGWFLDGIFGTAPLLLVGFLLLGIAAGFVNTVRTARRMSAELDQQSGKGDS